jgi:hypothetical protein
MGITDEGLIRSYRGFNAYADAFRKESEAHEK